MFALHLALFWSGLALLADALRLGRVAHVGADARSSRFAPVPWLLRGHVWTDVGLFSRVAVRRRRARASACDARRALDRRRAAGAVLCGRGAAQRVAGVVPLAVWIGWLALASTVARARGAVSRSRCCAALVAVRRDDQRQVQRRVPLWPAAAEWDLAAISVASGEMLLPPFMIGPGLDVAELAAAFRHWSIMPMLQNTRTACAIRSWTITRPSNSARCASAWFAAIRAHPRAWLAHHCAPGAGAARRARSGLAARADLRRRRIPATATIRRSRATVRRCTRSLMRAAAWLSTTRVLAGWPYLVIGLVALPFAWRRRARSRRHRRADRAGECVAVLLPLIRARRGGAALSRLELPRERARRCARRTRSASFGSGPARIASSSST